MAGAEGLGDQGVEADEEAFTEKGEDDEDAGADADGTDGLGAIWKAADHHGCPRMTMLIQPSSARTSGRARRSVEGVRGAVGKREHR